MSETLGEGVIWDGSKAATIIRVSVTKGQTEHFLWPVPDLAQQAGWAHSICFWCLGRAGNRPLPSSCLPRICWSCPDWYGICTVTFVGLCRNWVSDKNRMEGRGGELPYHSAHIHLYTHIHMGMCVYATVFSRNLSLAIGFGMVLLGSKELHWSSFCVSISCQLETMDHISLFSN